MTATSPYLNRPLRSEAQVHAQRHLKSAGRWFWAAACCRAKKATLLADLCDRIATMRLLRALHLLKREPLP